MRYDLISDEKIKIYLRTHTLAQRIYAFWSIRSTNEFAYKLATQGEKEGALIIAEEQTRGRGRMDRTWHSPFGKGLWFSLILRPPAATTRAGLYPFLAGISVAQAIENTIGLLPDMKWPNDLLIDDKKFCGILSEVEFTGHRIDFIVLGIGININHKLEDFPEELRYSATSLRIEARSKIDRIALLARIIHLLEQHYYFSLENGFELITHNWKKRCPSLGKKVHLVQNEMDYYGIFENLDENGCLLLRTTNGQLKKIVAGDFI